MFGSHFGRPIRRLAIIALATSLWTTPAVADDTAQAFKCCDDPRLTRVVDAYLDVHTALAANSEKDTRTAMKALLPASRDTSGYSRADRAALNTLHKLVDDAVDGAIGAIREAFDPISRQVIFLALRHQGGDSRVAEALCPQVGPWLQADVTVVASPYGETCGRWR